MKGKGTATITATYGNAKATCSVTVTGTESGSSTGQYTLSGTWTVNDTLVNNYEFTPIDLNFTSNGKEYTHMRMSYNGESDIVLFYGYSNYTIEETAWDVSNGWSNEAYRTVDFGSTTQTVSETFYNWFTTNATEQSTAGEQVTAKIYFSDGSYELTANENSTWAEVVGDGLSFLDSKGYTWNLNIVDGYIEAASPDNDAPASSATGTLVLSTDTFGTYTDYYWDYNTMLLYGGGSN